jgi:hypothetical protein
MLSVLNFQGFKGSVFDVEIWKREHWYILNNCVRVVQWNQDLDVNRSKILIVVSIVHAFLMVVIGVFW